MDKGDVRSTRDLTDSWLRLGRDEMGRPVYRSTQGQRTCLCGKGRSRFLPGRRQRASKAVEAVDTQDAALYEADRTHRGIWVEPELLAEIEYRAKSAEGKVRHPFFKGLREDLS